MSEQSLPLPPTRALDPVTQAFPRLTPAQIDRMRPLGTIRSVSPGDILFEVGDAGISMFVMLSGKMEIVHPEQKGGTGGGQA
jgi:CRP-like cAMP-binding protein